jgi:hypothetical protein
LLKTAAAQAQPHRLLFVFAGAELPNHPSAAQRENFLAGRGGALAALMCVDKAAGELTDFDSLARESRAVGPPWQVVFAAALSGRNGSPPAKTEIDAALKTMVEAIRVGGIGQFAAFDPNGDPLRFH